MTKGMSSRRVCDFFLAFAHLLMTLLAIIRCSESKKLNENPVRRTPTACAVRMSLTRMARPEDRY